MKMVVGFEEMLQGSVANKEGEWSRPLKLPVALTVSIISKYKLWKTLSIWPITWKHFIITYAVWVASNRPTTTCKPEKPGTRPWSTRGVKAAQQL